MILAGSVDGFQGIEIASLSGQNDSENLLNKAKRSLARILVGEQDKITIIGPASIVKEMKRDPTKMELLLQKR